MIDVEKELAAQGYSLETWANGPGAAYPVHDHPYHKVIVVQKGSITFRLTQVRQSFDLKAGDRLELPARTPHSALVGPEGVTCLEGHRDS